MNDLLPSSLWAINIRPATAANSSHLRYLALGPNRKQIRASKMCEMSPKHHTSRAPLISMDLTGRVGGVLES